MAIDKVEAFKDILEQNSEDAFARYGLAMEYRQRGDNGEALAQFEELRRRSPSYIAGYQMAAQLLMGEGRLPEAKQWLQAGIAIARSAGNRHAISEMEGMLDEAEEQLR